MKWHSPEQSYLEGVFSRGDRRLAQLLIRAWDTGARLDGWHDHLDFNLWQNAAKDCGLALDTFLRERQHDEILPWHHLSTGVDQAFLLGEWQKAVSEVYTPDCRYHGCQKCGLCDFDTLRPIVHSTIEPGTAPDKILPSRPPRQDKRSIPAHDENHFKYLVSYSRTGNICYLGHLEFLQLIFRALRRANITTNFSKGFNPTPKVSFAPALPVGTISNSEFFIMDLPELLPDPGATATLLSSKLPTGLKINSIELHSGNLPAVTETCYTLKLTRPVRDDEVEMAAHFLSTAEFVITRTRKGKERHINIRPLITELTKCSDDTFMMRVISKTAEPGIKPSDALHHIFGMDEMEALAAVVTKISWKEIDA